MDSAAAIGWYGPLIDLSSAPDHAGGYVQLLVLVHRPRPLLQVGDETSPLFHVSYPQEYQNKQHLFPAAAAVGRGDIALIRNVRIMARRSKAGREPAVEAAMTDVSSILVLVTEGARRAGGGGGCGDDVASRCRVGVAVKEKLERVVSWAREEARLLAEGFTRNWKLQEHRETVSCTSIAQVRRLINHQNRKPCNASFRAAIDQILLPCSGVGRHDPNKSNISGFSHFRPLSAGEDVVKDLICLGCKRCCHSLTPTATPPNHPWPHRRREGAQATATAPAASTLLCLESADRAHLPGAIYRPFLMHVSDHSGQLPVRVRNRAAEVLFGNIPAEKVSKCSKVEGRGRRPDFHEVWLILLRSLLLPHGRNSSFRFEVTVDPDEEPWDGGFELVGFAMPVEPDKASVMLPSQAEQVNIMTRQ